MPSSMGFRVERVASIDSTNTELMRRAKCGNYESVVLIAHEQTSGKGRLGRVWHSAPGAALTLSLGVLLSPPDWSGFSLAVGLGLVDALDPHRALGVQLKWPNDLWVGEPQRARKLCGILIELVQASSPSADVMGLKYCVIGIGLNLDTPKAPNLTRAGVGLRDINPGVNEDQVLERLIKNVVNHAKLFERLGFGAFLQSYEACDILRNQHVSLSNGVVGLCCGVNGRGELLVKTTDGALAVASDEVTLLSTRKPDTGGI